MAPKQASSMAKKRSCQTDWLTTSCKVRTRLMATLWSTDAMRARVQAILDFALELAGVVRERILGWTRGSGIPVLTKIRRPGFAHGPSGVAFAISRLADTCSVGGFEACIDALLAGEDEAFEAGAGNWQDVHAPDPTAIGRQASYRASWCNGAPGIALARASLRTPKSSVMAAALETTAACKTGGDSICCGEAGRAAILLRLGKQLGDAGWLEAGLGKVHNLAVRERYTFFKDDEGSVFSPGLFSGLAGIGYTLLQHATKGALPEIITFS